VKEMMILYLPARSRPIRGD